MVREGRFEPQKPSDLISDSYHEVLESKAPLLGINKNCYLPSRKYWSCNIFTSYNTIAGSCTACIVSLSRDDKTIYAANLGDSGFRIIREGRMVHRSEEQQHYFNTPFQLAVAPSTLQGMVFSDR